jgi:hypothetical protein
MNENTITITLEEYKELLRKAERIATVERMIASTNYVNVEDIEVALDIKKAKEN